MIQEQQVSNIGVVGGHIRADRPLTHVEAHLPAHSGFMLYMIGQPASGKTSLLISMLTAKKPNRVYRKAFQIIIAVMDPMSYLTISSEAFKARINFIFHELNVETINEISEICRYYAHYHDDDFEDGVDILLILDDVAKQLKTPAIQARFGMLALNRRHHKLSIIITSQFYRALVPNLRSNISHLIMFQAAKREFANIFEEHLPYSKEQISYLFEHIFKKPHDFMYFDIQKRAIYRNFNTLLRLQD